MRWGANLRTAIPAVGGTAPHGGFAVEAKRRSPGRSWRLTGGPPRACRVPWSRPPLPTIRRVDSPGPHSEAGTDRDHRGRAPGPHLPSRSFGAVSARHRRLRRCAAVHGVVRGKAQRVGIAPDRRRRTRARPEPPALIPMAWHLRTGAVRRRPRNGAGSMRWVGRWVSRAVKRQTSPYRAAVPRRGEPSPPRLAAPRQRWETARRRGRCGGLVARPRPESR